MNCWEFKKCGREKGGFKEEELGRCPVYPDQGKHCARTEGTLCGGEVQRHFALKFIFCRECDFYKSEHYDKTYGEGGK